MFIPKSLSMTKYSHNLIVTDAFKIALVKNLPSSLKVWTNYILFILEQVSIYHQKSTIYKSGIIPHKETILSFLQ